MAAILSGTIRFLTCGYCCGGEQVAPLPADEVHDDIQHAAVDPVAEAVAAVAEAHFQGAAAPPPQPAAMVEADEMAGPPQLAAADELVQELADAASHGSSAVEEALGGILAGEAINEGDSNLHSSFSSSRGEHSSEEEMPEGIEDIGASRRELFQPPRHLFLEKGACDEDGSRAVFSHSSSESGEPAAAAAAGRPPTPRPSTPRPTPQERDRRNVTVEFSRHTESGRSTVQTAASAADIASLFTPEHIALHLTRKHSEFASRFGSLITDSDSFISDLPDVISSKDLAKNLTEVFMRVTVIDGVISQFDSFLEAFSIEDARAFREAHREAHPEILPFFALYETLHRCRGMCATYMHFLHSADRSFKSTLAPMCPERIILPESLRETLRNIRAGACFEYGSVIGRGCYGTVSKAKLGSQRYAIKCMVTRNRDGTFFEEAKINKRRDIALAEIATLFALPPSFFLARHVFSLVRTKDAITLFPRAECDFFSEIDRGAIPVTRLRPLLGDVIQGIFAMHRTTVLLPGGGEQQGVVHSDLKPENLLLYRDASGEEHLKLTDFGISGIVGQKFRGGTPMYQAPESFRRGYTLDPKMDIWALGVICATLLFDRHPFSEEFIRSHASWTQEAIDSELESILEGEETAERMRVEDGDGTMLRFIKRCLRFNPDERPTIEEVGDDPFIAPGLRSRLGEDPRDARLDSPWQVLPGKSVLRALAAEEAASGTQSGGAHGATAAASAAASAAHPAQPRYV